MIPRVLFLAVSLGFRIVFDTPADSLLARIDGVILERSLSPDSAWAEVARADTFVNEIWDLTPEAGVRYYYRARYYTVWGDSIIPGLPGRVCTGLELDWSEGADVVRQVKTWYPPEEKRVLLVVNVPYGDWIGAWSYFPGAGETVYFRSEFERTFDPETEDWLLERIDLSDLSFWASILSRDLSLFARFAEQYNRRSIFRYEKGGRLCPTK